MNYRTIFFFCLFIFIHIKSLSQTLTVTLSSPMPVLECDCPDGYGDINASITGGTAPYTYLWSTGAVTGSINYLLPGTYTLTITDALSATATDSFTLNMTPDFWANLSFIATTPGKCNGVLYFNPWCQTTPMNSTPGYTWYDGYNHAMLICNPGPWITHEVYSNPTNCPSMLNGFTFDPDIKFTGPCDVINISDPQQAPCSNTRFKITNQHVLDVTGFPFQLNIWNYNYFGFPQAKLFDMQGIQLGSTLYNSDLMQNLTEKDFDFGLNITGVVIFEYFEGILDGDTIGVHLRDTFNLFEFGCGTFSGKIFYDSNNDCAFQPPNDLLMPNTTLNIQPVNLQVLTNDSGQFSAYLPFGFYTVSQFNPFGFDQECPSIPFNFQLNSISPVFIQNIADTSAFPPLCDLSVNLYLTVARPGFDHYIFLQVENANIQNAPATLLTLTVDSLLQFVSASNGGQDSGNVISWNIPPLNGFSSITTTTRLQVPAGTTLGTVLSSVANISLESCDTNNVNNSATGTRIVTGSMDPNQITVSPIGAGPQHITPPDYRLHYMVEFENTGTDTAFKVIIIDTLPSFLNPNSLLVEMASHNYLVELLSDSILKFTFDNILLPDSNTNTIESKGYITFGIDQDPGLSDGVVITNKAEIYFDFNLPVVTNEVFNTINYGPITSCQDITIIIDSTNYATLLPSLIDAGTYDFYGPSVLSLSQSSFNCQSPITNIVTMYATSLNGLVDSCQSTVTVTENIFPIALCHDTVFMMDTTCLVTISAVDIDNGSTDNCNQISYSLSQSTFNCSNIGVNTVTMTVTDLYGNTSQCTSQITIIDVTGLWENSSLNEKLLIIPNPSSGMLVLPETSLHGQLTISDISGKKVFENNNLQNTTLDFTCLQSGIYLVKLIINKNVLYGNWIKTD